LRQLRLSIATLALLALSSPAFAVLTFDPGRQWRTLETTHFRIHFHEGLEDIARRAATIGERVHDELTREFRWRPRDKTEVVLTDDFDLPNGYATPIPYNLMVLFVVPPEPGGQLEADSHDQWLEDLIIHEYTHVLHLDKAAGLPLGLRRVLGRNPYTFPNLMQPIWLIEGLATHQETDPARGVGRGQGSKFAMMLRAEVANGMRPLSQVSVPNVSWPAGIVPYLYGVHFFQFLVAEYGEDAVADFVERYSRNIVPYLVNRTARQAFGKDMRELWREFEQHLEWQHGGMLDALRSDGLERGSSVTEDGFAGLQQGGNLQALPDGRVYFVRDDGLRRSALMLRTPDGTLTRIADLNRGARFHVHPIAGVLVAQPEQCREYRINYDLFLMRPGERRLRRITHCGRYRDVAWHPDGEQIAAVRYVAGRSELDLLRSDGRRVRTLAAPDDALLAQPDWSPDGERMLLVRTARGEGGDLFEFTPATGEWRRLTADRNIPSHPRYTPDGRALLFTSDHGGVFNVRRLPLDGSAVETLTHVDTGAFQPDQAGRGGDIYFLLYGPRGYDLHVLSAPTPRATPAARVLPDPEPAVERWAGADAKPYRPWGTLTPRTWLPYLRIDPDLREVGLYTFGRDALGHHSWFVQPVWDITHGDLIGSAGYLWRDRLNVHGARRNELIGRYDQIRRNDFASVSWHRPVTRLDRAWSFALGAAREHEYDHDVPAEGIRFADWHDNLVSAGLLYRSSLFHRLSISEQDGRRVRLVAERSVGDSDFSGNVYTLDWREYVSLGAGNHVLAARYVIGWGTDRTRPFVLGGGDVTGDGVFNRRRYGLRGYETGAPELIGRRMELAALEYRFPLALVERGLLWPPLGLHRWSGQLFIEGGRAWQDQRPGRWHTAAGTEAVLDLTIGGWMLLRGRLGYAHGFDEEAGGGNRLYFTLGSAF
jgi:hypothetical protein